MNIKVQKRDGEIETYESEKIGRVVIACGLEAKEAQKLVEEIDGWVKQFEGGTITSRQIRDRILLVLPKYNEYSARQFAWWEKYKDKYKIV